MIERQTESTSGLAARFGRILRAVFAGVLALAFVALVFFLAAAVTVAALIFAGLALLAGGAWWLWRKARSVKRAEGDPNLLVARRGPQGWTVESASRSGG